MGFTANAFADSGWRWAACTEDMLAEVLGAAAFQPKELAELSGGRNN